MDRICLLSATSEKRAPLTLKAPVIGRKEKKAMKPEMINDDFYPTPPHLASRMASLIKGYPQNILEPSAGRGNIIEAMQTKFRHSWGSKIEVSAIEIDQDLRAILRTNDIKVIDSDFLAFAGPDKFDLIIANPPFYNGELHLMKAIDIMYCGQIIFLLNAETIKNPCTMARKELTRRLDKLGATIEYLQSEFTQAERKTKVEVALVNIMIERDVTSDLFGGAGDVAVESNTEVKDKHELTTGHTISDMVAEYNEIVNIATETILGYYKNYKKIGFYIGLNKDIEKSTYSSSDLTTKVQNTLNSTLRLIRKSFWIKALELKEVKSRLTEARRKEFEHQIEMRKSMDFTENNVRSFVLNMINGYNDTLTKAVLEIFDKMTVRHCFDDGLRNENIHLYNGWKTNKAFKVGKKVILPLYGGGYGNGPFTGYSGQWELNYSVKNQLHDIDIVMQYFDAREGCYEIVEALEHAFKTDKSSSIESTYFKITVYKKGTIHLTFLDDDILRRFNLAASAGKGWLPNGYGQKPYGDMQGEEKAVIESFEGKNSYEKNLGQKIFAKSIDKLPLLIAA